MQSLIAGSGSGSRIFQRPARPVANLPRSFQSSGPRWWRRRGGLSATFEGHLGGDARPSDPKRRGSPAADPRGAAVLSWAPGSSPGLWDVGRLLPPPSSRLGSPDPESPGLLRVRACSERLLGRWPCPALGSPSLQPRAAAEPVLESWRRAPSTRVLERVGWATSGDPGAKGALSGQWLRWAGRRRGWGPAWPGSLAHPRRPPRAPPVQPPA